MGTRRVVEYGVNHFPSETTYFRLKLDTGGWKTVMIKDPMVSANWVDLLRNESPVHVVEETSVLFTGVEPVGEAEF